LGSCTHPLITGLRINRHNAAVRRIAKAIRESDKPSIKNAAVYMDAGTAEDEIIASQGSRVPDWLLPDIDEEVRKKLRPDLLCFTVPMGFASQDVPALVNQRSSTIYVLEVSFCGDTRYRDRMAVKSTQHQQLVDLLTTKGFHVVYPPPLLFGIGGSLYKETLTTLTNTLHIKQATADRTARKIQYIAAHSAYQIVSTRRSKEMELGKGPPKNPRKRPR